MYVGRSKTFKEHPMNGTIRCEHVRLSFRGNAALIGSISSVASIPYILWMVPPEVPCTGGMLISSFVHTHSSDAQIAK